MFDKDDVNEENSRFTYELRIEVDSLNGLLRSKDQDLEKMRDYIKQKESDIDR